MSHYLNSDLLVAGMPKADHGPLPFGELDPLAKWKLLAPCWPAVKNTGYAQAVRIAIRELYGVDELSAATVQRSRPAMRSAPRRDFTSRSLQDRARIESCQVNCLTGEPFKQSDMPSLLMQDISIVGMFAGPSLEPYAAPAGIEVKALGRLAPGH